MPSSMQCHSVHRLEGFIAILTKQLINPSGLSSGEKGKSEVVFSRPDTY